MTDNKNRDFLIVGQGIAGTLLAHELDKRGQTVVVIDNGANNASLTCAGMVNPVVLKRFSPVWQGKQQILHARQLMAELEDKLSLTLMHQFDILRVFHNEQEQKTWCDKATLPALDGLLDAQLYPAPSDKLHAPLGVGRVHWGGRVDVRALLTGYRAYLRDNDQLREETFDYQQLKVTDSGCTYGDIRARNVVFCEGFRLKNNPYFKTLPLNGNKGEVLTVRIPDLKLSATVKSAVFLMPLPECGESVYFVGATYNWTDKDNRPSQAARTQLLDKLSKLLPADVFACVEVCSQHAGMRPTVSDRRPLLGRHPEHQRLFVFNGLGTRGVMLGASMATHLSQHLLDRQALPAEVDIARFLPR